MADYAASFNRHRLPAILVFLTVLGTTIGYTAIQTPMYRAEAEVLLRTRDSDAVFEAVSNSELSVIRLASAERDFAETDQFQSVARQAAPAESVVTVGVKTIADGSFTSLSSTLVFTAESRSAEEAASAAQEWADTYIDVRSAQTISDFERAVDQIASDLAGVEKQLETLLDPVTQLDAAIAASSDDERTALIQARSEAQSAISLDETRLRSTIDRLDRRQAALLDGEFVLTRRDASARLSSAPQVPESPFDPNLQLNLALGLLVGGLASFAVPLLLEALNSSIRTSADIGAFGLAVLGSVPVLTDIEGEKPVVHTVDRSRSIAADSYRSIATAIQFLRVGRQLRIIQVVSAEPGAGKTTTAVNLAGAFALTGSPTVLVDADLRRPRVDRYFAIETKPGLSDYLGVGATVDEISKQQPGTDFQVIPCGSAAPNPSELLGSVRFIELMKTLGSAHETVVVDCAPVLAAPDTRVIAHAVEGIVIVVRVGETKKSALAATLEQLRVTQVPIIGVVMNGDRNFAKNTYGGYGYDEVARA